MKNKKIALRNTECVSPCRQGITRLYRAPQLTCVGCAIPVHAPLFLWMGSTRLYCDVADPPCSLVLYCQFCGYLRYRCGLQSPILTTATHFVDNGTSCSKTDAKNSRKKTLLRAVSWPTISRRLVISWSTISRRLVVSWLTIRRRLVISWSTISRRLVVSWLTISRRKVINWPTISRRLVTSWQTQLPTSH